MALPSSARGFPLESEVAAPGPTVTCVWSTSDSIFKVKNSATLGTRVNPDPSPIHAELRADHGAPVSSLSGRVALGGAFFSPYSGA